MLCAQINGSVVEKFPYTETEIRRDYPSHANKNLYMVENLPDGIVRVWNDPDHHVGENQAVSFAKTPTLVNGKWIREATVFNITPSTPSENELQGRSELASAGRDNLLKTEVDPVVSNPLLWADLTTEKQAEWTQYRTALLNVPDQAGFPIDITWPTKPE